MKLSDIKSNIKTVGRVLSILGKRKTLFLAFIFGFCLVESACTVLYSVGLRGVINAISRADLSSFWMPMTLVVANHMLWWIYAPISSAVTFRITAASVAEYKTSLCEHIMRLPMIFTDGRDKGELLSVLSNDARCFENILDNNYFNVCRTALGGVVGVILMAVIDIRFAAVVFVLGTLSVFAAARYSAALEKSSGELQDKLSKTSVDTYELVRASKTVRLLCLQNNRREKIYNTVDEEAKIRTSVGKVSAKMNASVSFINVLSYIAVIFIGALFVRASYSDWGTVIALLSLKYTADMLFVEFPQFYNELVKDVAGAKRVFELEDVGAETERVYEPCGENHALEVDCVSFGYGEDDIIENFSAAVKYNSLTVISGESGCGKSTLMKLMLGLYEPRKGRILTESGRDCREICSYVPQDATLFRASIYDNIAFGCNNASVETVKRAAVSAGADEFIGKLPDGYSTLLEDLGDSLSGGQKQRIAIARALTRDTPVLMLDEITSALDRDTAGLIIGTVKELSKSKAVVFITHDRDIEALADNVIRL